jgi:cell division protein ZapA (FtsZ GTPase activity inhibitor)
MPVQLVTIQVLGASFSIQTDESKEYMEALLGELERRLDALSASTHVSDPLKLSILANITLLDEVAALRREAGAVDGEDLGRLADRLIGRLDEGLSIAAADDEVPEDAGSLAPKGT